MSAFSNKDSWQHLDREKTQAAQGQRLHRYLRDCVLPFSVQYQRVFKENGLTAADIRSVADLQKIPFTP